MPLCFGLLAILLTSLSQAASQYKSIPELIEDQRKVPLYNEPITEDGGGVHQGIYSIGLEAINK